MNPHASTLAAPPSAPATPLPAGDQRRRNWWLHVLEAGIGIGAMTAINSNTVGTALVEHLGGAPWAVALVPLLMTMGFSCGPLLSAHHVDRQERFLPVLRRTMPLSRLALPVIAAVLWWAGDGRFALWTVLAGYLWFGLVGGMGVGAWQQLVAKTVAPRQRPALFASRYLASNLIGLGAGLLVTIVLARWPGDHGFALLHLVALAGCLLSIVLLMQVREHAEAPHPLPHGHGFWRNLREAPALVLGDRDLRLYLLSAVLLGSQYLLVGFLALHARDVLGRGDDYIGTLTAAQMVGAVAGTMFAAWRGNHHGSRSLLLIARGLLLATALGALVAGSDWAFRALFACYGAAFWIALVGNNAITLELLPPARRATVLAVAGAVQVPSMIVAAQVGAWLWHAQVAFAWIAALSALGLLASLLTMLPVRTKRG